MEKNPHLFYCTFVDTLIDETMHKNKKIMTFPIFPSTVVSPSL